MAVYFVLSMLGVWALMALGWGHLPEREEYADWTSPADQAEEVGDHA